MKGPLGMMLHRFLYFKNHKKRMTPQNRLSYFVLDILDHCNLNCKGCDHFAPLAKDRFVSLDDIKSDLAQVSLILQGDVKRIGVMGGEPLLHPELKEILIQVRLFFPKTKIHLVTNGILLMRQEEAFWRVCRENKITIVNTKYPINLNYKEMKSVSSRYGVKFRHYGNTGTFKKTSAMMPLDIAGNQNPTDSFILCYLANRYPLLMEGKFYGCTIAPNFRHFNKRFGTKMELSEGDFVDIYAIKDVTDLLSFFASPKSCCRYCDVKNRVYKQQWQRSRREMSEWIR